MTNEDTRKLKVREQGIVRNRKKLLVWYDQYFVVPHTYSLHVSKPLGMRSRERRPIRSHCLFKPRTSHKLFTSTSHRSTCAVAFILGQQITELGVKSASIFKIFRLSLFPELCSKIASVVGRSAATVRVLTYCHLWRWRGIVKQRDAGAVVRKRCSVVLTFGEWRFAVAVFDSEMTGKSRRNCGVIALKNFAGAN